MGKQDKRIDDYILKSAGFAKPILQHLRSLVHIACPDVVETVKWGMPFFDYKGTLCNMAAFKEHCAFGFWKNALMKDANEMKGNNENSMGHLGRITSVKDLPDKKIIEWIKEAVKLNEDGVKVAQKKKPMPKEELIMPAELQKELNKNKAAANTFSNFSPSHKREYLEWIAEAKTAETKNKRIATTIEWLKEGKSRHWKYKK